MIDKELRNKVEDLFKNELKKEINARLGNIAEKFMEELSDEVVTGIYSVACDKVYEDSTNELYDNIYEAVYEDAMETACDGIDNCNFHEYYDLLDTINQNILNSTKGLEEIKDKLLNSKVSREA